MKLAIRNLLFFLGMFPCLLSAQIEKEAASMADYEKQMSEWGHTIIFDSLAENRLAANVQLAKTLENVLAMPGAFEYSFDSLKTISFKYPADSTFRVITWQLYVDIDEYQYFGFIQHGGEKPVVTRLTDKSEEIDDLKYDAVTADQWYGAVYYKMISFDTPEGVQHLLFGFDGHSLFRKRKLIDVLTFQDGKAVFGSPVFSPEDISRTDLYKNRILLEYSAEAMITLNYNDDMGMIVMDHLIPFSGSAQIEGESFVPDGSYEGYKLEGALWVYKEKLFDQVSETAPRPNPILEKRKGTSIIGKKN